MNELPSTSGSRHCLGDRVCTDPMCPRHGLGGSIDDALRAAVHGHVQVIRGMCSDEVDHREIDRALVRLDDVIYSSEPSPSNTGAVRTPTPREEQS
jgi:hypothetical protein